jgi:hypothetical protein
MKAGKRYMMKFIKLFVPMLFIGIFLNIAEAKEVPGYVPTFKNCPWPKDMCWVMRCEEGDGTCNPSAQYFCDEICN